MLHYETISPDTLGLLKKAQSLDILQNTMLIGGTALALQIGHRVSIDLDFFGKADAELEELAEEFSSFASTVSPISASKMMRFLIVDGIKIDIVNYNHPWIDKPVVEDGIRLAGIRDIAAMKLSAITNRGTKKDFIDYYFLLQIYSLDELISFYRQKYSEAQLFTSIKSLTYFGDAETDPMPRMLVPIRWDDVKTSIITAVKQYLSR